MRVGNLAACPARFRDGATETKKGRVVDRTRPRLGAAAPRVGGASGAERVAPARKAPLDPHSREPLPVRAGKYGQKNASVGSSQSSPSQASAYRILRGRARVW